jgi:hypothetical protein
MFLKRVADTNNKVTKDKIYEATEVIKRTYILDDNGNKFAPSYKNKDYWVEVNDTDIISNSTKKESKMVKIKNVVMINDTNSDDISDEEMLNMIEQEQEKLIRLQELNIKSNAISKIKSRHVFNIERLTELLDERYS